ncbi:MAG: dTDP-4-dehydrorhamnose reductase [Mycobacteriaceae bacterium]
MRLLVTGGRGQLGTDVALRARAAGWDVTAPGSAELDITDARALDGALTGVDVVVNCAAYTAVDAAESAPAAAAAINDTGAGLVAAACAAHSARLVHVSTDYVFDGAATAPYEPGDPTGPRSVYGRTKLAGETAVLLALPTAHVVRTAWVYGPHGANFVATMARLEGERDTIDVVDDQQGSPTATGDLALGLLELAAAVDTPGGVLHATAAGQTTWCGLARAVFVELGADPERVRPTTTDAFPRPAPRPAYSVLSGRAWAAAGLTPLADWRAALHRAVSHDGLLNR